MNDLPEAPFDLVAFLSNAAPGRKLVRLKAKERFFAQGDPADWVFYLQAGRAKLAVASPSGRVATIGFLSPGDFIGQEALVPKPVPRAATATAITACLVLRIDRQQMANALHEQRSLSDLFMRFLLTRSIRIQEDLLDQFFNSGEKRLARVLYLMAEFDQTGQDEVAIPPVTQESLAEMIGTTRSRVSFFMNRLRKLGFIEYDGGIRVRRSLLSVVLHESPQSVREERQ